MQIQTVKKKKQFLLPERKVSFTAANLTATRHWTHLSSAHLAISVRLQGAQGTLPSHSENAARGGC